MDMPTITGIERSANQDSVRLAISISPGLDVFRGHFDEAPIVPGVVQIHWALRLANQYLVAVSPLAIDCMEAVKFQQVMTPGAELTLDLELINNKLVFAYRSPAASYSSGKIPLTP